MLSRIEISGLSGVALQYWITASDDALLSKADSGIIKADAKVDDSKAAALVRPRMLVATTTRSRLSSSRESCSILDVDEISRAREPGNNSARQELSHAWLLGTPRPTAPSAELQPHLSSKVL